MSSNTAPPSPGVSPESDHKPPHNIKSVSLEDNLESDNISIDIEEQFLPDNELHKDIDQGWAWVILLSGFLSFALLSGLYNTFSIHYVELLNMYSASRGYTAMIGAVYSSVFFLGGLPTTFLIIRFGCRITIIAGGIISAFGYICASLSSNLVLILISYGIIAALGLSFNFSGWVVTLGTYFQSKHAISTSLAMTGFGCGLFFFGPAMELIVAEYGYHGSLLINAGLALQFCVLGALVFPLKIRVDEWVTNDYVEDWVNETNDLMEEVSDGLVAERARKTSDKMGRRTPSKGSFKEIPLKGSIVNLQLSPSASFLSHSINSMREQDIPIMMRQRRDSNRSSSFISLPVYHSDEDLTITEGDIRDRAHSFAGSVLKRPEFLKERLRNRKKNSETNLTVKKEEPAEDIPRYKEFPCPKNKSVMKLRKLGAVPVKSWHSDILEDVQEQDSEINSEPGDRKSISINDIEEEAPNKESELTIGIPKIDEEPSESEELLKVEKEAMRKLDEKTTVLPAVSDDGSTVETKPAIKPEPKKAVFDLSDQEPSKVDPTPGPVFKKIAPELPEVEEEEIYSPISLCDRELLRDPKFWCLNFSGLTWVMGTMTLYVLYKDFAASKGLTQRFVYALAGIGLGDLLGRLFAGTISSWSFVSSVFYYSVAQIMCGAVILYHPFVTTMEQFVTVCVFMGISYGQENVLLAIAPAEVYGRNNLALVFGYILFFCGIGAIIGPPVAGWMYDSVKSYDTSFTFVGISTIMGGVVTMMCYVMNKRSISQRKKLIQMKKKRRQSSIKVIT